MEKYKVTITEILKMAVEVEAETRQDALQKVVDEYHAGKHVLTADNCVDTEFDAVIYEVKKHFRDGMDLVYSTNNLVDALEYCFSDDTLCRGDGHALSIHNCEGSIFEINYFGSKGVDIDGVASEEEFAVIRDYIKKNS